MAKSILSSYRPASSSASPPNERAKSLGISHAGNVRQDATRSRASTPEQSRHDRDLDSGNFEAAIRLLQSRLDAGLTQEQVAARVGEDPKTIGQRERGKVALGPLRQLVLLERARDAKLKGSK
jgi:DNA-binding XRE family transcriptional regulator